MRKLLPILVLAVLGFDCAHESNKTKESETTPQKAKATELSDSAAEQRWIDIEELLAEHPRHPVVHGFPTHSREGFVIADESSEGSKLQEHDLVLQVLNAEGQIVDEFIILSEQEYLEHHQDSGFRVQIQRRIDHALARIDAKPDSFHPFLLQHGKNKQINGAAKDLTLHYDPDTLSVKVHHTPSGRSIRHKLTFETVQRPGENLCSPVQPMLAGAWASRLRDFIVLRIRFSGKVDTCRQPGDRFEVLQLSHGTE